MGDTESKSSQEDPEPGDLIEIFRGLYNHWCVFVGDGEVVHLTVPDGASGSSSSRFPSVPTKKGLVKKEPLSKAVGGRKYCIHKMYNTKYDHRSQEEIVRDAEAMVGERVDYNLFRNNCEHFATRLHHGVPECKQVEEGVITGGVIIGGLAAVGLAAVAATQIYKAVKGRRDEEYQ